MIDIHFDLGNHNVLLETNYDLWAWINYLGPLPTSNEPTGSHTLKVWVGLKAILMGHLIYEYYLKHKLMGQIKEIRHTHLRRILDSALWVWAIKELAID